MSHPVLFTVAVPARVTLRPSTTQTLQPGDIFRVECSAFDPVNNRQVRVEWSRDRGADLSPTATVDDGVLEIVSVTGQDAGLYRCTAHNEAGPSFVVIELVIFGHFRVFVISLNALGSCKRKVN